MTTTATTGETQMITRLEELLHVRAALWPDREDAATLSELTAIQTQITKLERELGIRRREDRR